MFIKCLKSYYKSTGFTVSYTFTKTYLTLSSLDWKRKHTVIYRFNFFFNFGISVISDISNGISGS